MYHCYYCRGLIQIVPKFKRLARESGHLQPVSSQFYICSRCKAEYKLTIEVIHPTGLSIETLQEWENKPVE